MEAHPEVKEQVDAAILRVQRAVNPEHPELVGPAWVSDRQLRELVPDSEVAYWTNEAGEKVPLTYKNRNGDTVPLTVRGLLHRAWPAKMRAMEAPVIAAPEAVRPPVPTEVTEAAGEAAPRIGAPEAEPKVGVTPEEQARFDEAAAERQRIVAELEEGKKKRLSETLKGRAEEKRARADTLLAEINARMAGAGKETGKLGAYVVPPLDVETIAKIVQYAAIKLEQFGLDAAALGAHLVEQFGERIRPHLPRIIEEAQAELKPAAPTAAPVIGAGKAEVAGGAPRIGLPETARMKAERVRATNPPTADETEAINAFYQWAVKRSYPGIKPGEYDDVIQDTVRRALTSRRWKALAAETELPMEQRRKFQTLKGILSGTARTFQTEQRRRIRGREISLEDYAKEGKGGKRPRQVSTEDVIVPRVTGQRELESAERDASRRAAWRKQAKWVQTVAERKMGRTDAEGQEDVVLSLLDKLPSETVRGRKFYPERKLGLVGTKGDTGDVRLREKLNLIHAAIRDMEDPSAEAVQDLARQNGWDPKLVKTEFSRTEVSNLKRVYRDIFSGPEYQAPEHFRTEEDVLEEAAGEAADIGGSPEAWIGLKRGEIANRMEFAPEPGRAAATMGRAVGPGGRVESTRVRVHGPGDSWVEVARADTPAKRVVTGGTPDLMSVGGRPPEGMSREEYRAQWVGKAREAADAWVETIELNPARSINITNSRGSDPEAVAAVVRDLFQTNPALETVVVKLRPEGGVQVALNSTVERALRTLEKEGLLEWERTVATEVSPVQVALTKPVAPGLKPATRVRHAPEVGPVHPLEPRAEAGVGVREAAWGRAEAEARVEALRKVQELRAQARRLRYVATHPLRPPSSPLVPYKPTPFAVPEGPAVGELAKANKAALKQAGELEKEADALAAKWGRANRYLAERGGPSVLVPTEAERIRRPTVRIYKRPGSGTAAERAVANSSMIPDDALAPDLLALKQAHFLDVDDAAPVVDGVKVVDADGAYNGDRAVLDPIARAHVQIEPVLQAMVGRVSKALGLEAEHAGVLASPFTNAAVVMEAGRRGRVFSNPSMAHYVATREGTGSRGAAEHLLYSQVLEELAHLEQQRVLHGPEFQESMAKMVERVRGMARESPDLIDGLAKDELWAGLRERAPEFSRRMEDMHGGRLRESWRRAEGSVGGLRGGPPEGRLTSLSYRPGQAAAGPEAGGGLGLRPGAALPEGAGGAAGGLGEAAAHGPGHEYFGRGGAPGRVAGGGEGGRGEGTVRLYRVEGAAGKGVPEWVKDHPLYQNAARAQGRWFTDDLDEAQWYLRDNPGSRVVTLDLPAAEAEAYRVSNLPEVAGGKGVAENPRAFSRRPEKEFFVPGEVVERVRRREVAFAGTPSHAELKEQIENFRSLQGTRNELMEEAIRRSGELARSLVERVAAGDQAAGEELGRALASKPGLKGDLWNRINVKYRELPDVVRAQLYYWSRMTRENPELSKYFSADTPVHIEDLSREAQSWLELHGPEDLVAKFKSGKKVSLVDIEVARIASTDLIAQAAESERRLLEGMEHLGRLQGDEAARFGSEVLPGLEQEAATARSRMSAILPILTNESSTESARRMAIQKHAVAAMDPQSQRVHVLQEFLRQQLQGRYRDKNELNQVVGKLMGLYRLKRNELGWVDHGLDEFTEAVRKAYKFGKLDWFLEAFKSGLLGWPSRVANIGSNLAYFGQKQLEKDVATLVEQGWARSHGIAPERFAEEFLLKRRVLRRAFSGGIRAWIKAQRDAFKLRPLEMTGLGVSNELMEDFIRMPGAIRGKLGEFLRFQFKGMNADDALFKHLSKIDSYYREAYRSLKRGVSGWEVRPGESIWDATERYVQDMEDNITAHLDRGRRLDPKYAEIYKRASELAQEETFQKQLGPAALAGQRALHEGAGRWAQLVIPFYKTPINIGKAALARTPLNLITVATKWGDMSHAERMDAVARHVTGAAITAGLYSMVEGAGLELSGNGPLDPEANQLLKESGWAPYSVKLGDKWYSYQRFEPMASVLGMFADAMEGWKAGDYDRWETGMQRAVGTVTQNISSKTFLSGLENLTNMTADPLRYAGQFAKSQLAGLVPNSVGYLPMGHLARQIDPVYREVGIGPDVILNKLPWVSRTLPPQYAPTGEERVRPSTLGPRIVSPIQVATEKKTPEAKAARMLAEVGFPMRRVKDTFPYRGVKVDITREEQKALAQAQAKALAFIGARLMNDPNFQALPDNDDDAQFPGQRTKKDVLSRTVRRFRDPVVMRMNPELRQRAAALLRRRTEQEVGPGT